MIANLDDAASLEPNSSWFWQIDQPRLVNIAGFVPDPWTKLGEAHAAGSPEVVVYLQCFLPLNADFAATVMLVSHRR